MRAVNRFSPDMLYQPLLVNVVSRYFGDSWFLRLAKVTRLDSPRNINYIEPSVKLLKYHNRSLSYVVKGFAVTHSPLALQLNEVTLSPEHTSI